MLDSSAGSNVTTAPTLTSAISRPASPTLRSAGTGTTRSDSRLTATVTPEATTACPAVFIATTTASSFVRP